MLQVSKLLPNGRGLAPVLLKRAATVELDWDVRQKSRFEATDSQGRQIGVFLPRGTLVRGGDVLVAEDGSLIKVVAAPQPVLVITHCSEHGSPFDLTRAAYHLGNRHVPIELRPDHLKIEPDHVLADMLRSMHLIVSAQDAAFEPEGGAYGSHGHGSHGGHSHGHAPAKPKEKGFRPWAPELMPDDEPAVQPQAHSHDGHSNKPRHDHGHNHGHDHPHGHPH